VKVVGPPLYYTPAMVQVIPDQAVGTPVILTKDSGEEVVAITRSEAQVLSGHSAVIWLVGVTGCYLLDRVRFNPKGGAS